MSEMKKPVWVAQDLLFNSDRGFFTIKRGTKGYLVTPTDAERSRLATLREGGARFFVVELEGKRRYLERSQLLGEREWANAKASSKAKLSKLAKRRKR